MINILKLCLASLLEEFLFKDYKIDFYGGTGPINDKGTIPTLLSHQLTNCEFEL